MADVSGVGTEVGTSVARRMIEDLSPEEWLLRLKMTEPELIDEKDFLYLASIAPSSVLRACTERYLPMIWNKIIHPGDAKKRLNQSAVTGETEFQAFIDLLWFRYRKMTGQQARSEAGALVAVFATVEPKQTVEDAMTREQFGERFLAEQAGKPKAK